MQLIILNNHVFGHKRFKILDTLLFKNPLRDSVPDFVTIKSITYPPTGQLNGLMTMTVSTCVDVHLPCGMIFKAGGSNNEPQNMAGCYTTEELCFETTYGNDFPDMPIIVTGTPSGGGGNPGNGSNFPCASSQGRGIPPIDPCNAGPVSDPPILPVPEPDPYTLTAEDIVIFNEIDNEDEEANEILLNSECKGTLRTGNGNFQGTKEHWLLQLDYVSRHGITSEVEYGIPNSSVSGATMGFADIVNKQSNEIFEIKPDNPTGLINGINEVQRYVSKANQYCPTALGTIPPVWHQGTNYSEVYLPSGNPTKYLYPHSIAAGVIGYSLVEKTTVNPPLPVAIPSSVVTKLRHLVDKLRQSIGNADAILAEYLRENPDLVTYLKNAAYTAAVAIVVGTIIEDFVTLGAGLLDDIASFQLAYRIVRFAWKLP